MRVIGIPKKVKDYLALQNCGNCNESDFLMNVSGISHIRIIEGKITHRGTELDIDDWEVNISVTCRICKASFGLVYDMMEDDKE